MSAVTARAAVAAYFALCLAAVSVLGQKQAPRPLVTGEPALVELASGVPGLFSIAVAEGQFMRLKVTHAGANVSLALSDSRGRRLYSSPVQPWIGDWFGTILLRSGRSETLILQVTGVEVRADTAKAVVELAELRDFTEADMGLLEALATFNGGILKRSGSPEAMRSAQALFAKAGQDFMSAGDFTMAGVSLVNLGWVLQDLGELKSSIQFFTVAAQIFGNLKDPLAESKAYSGIGYSENEMGNYDAAIEAHQKSLSAKRAFGIAYEDSTSLINIGLSRILKRDYKGAVESCRLGLETGRSAKSADRERRALGCMATAQRETGDYEQALSAFVSIKQLAERSDDKNSQGEASVNIAMVYSLRSDFVRAIAAYQDALAAYKEAGNRSWEAQVLKSIATLYAGLNSYEKALSILEQSIAINAELGEAKSLASSFESLGFYNASLGRYPEAESNYRRALQRFTDIGDLAGQMEVQASLGYLFSRQGKFDESITYYDRAVAMIPQVRDEKAEIRVLAGAAWALMGTGEARMISKSREYFRMAAAKERASGPTAMLSMLYLGLGLSHLVSGGELEKAREAFGTSAQISRAAKSEFTEAWANSFLAQTLDEQKQTEGAILFGKKAVNTFQRIRSEVRAADETLVKDFLSDKISVYRSLSDRLISVGRLGEAQAVLDLLKDEEYAGLTRAGEKGVEVPYSLSEEKAVLAVENLAALGKRRLELEKIQNDGGALSADQQRELDRVYDDIEKANEAFRGALAALKEAQPGVKDKIAEIEGQQNLTAALEELQRETGEGAAAVYTVIGAEDSAAGTGKTKFGWAVLVTPKESKAYPMDVEGIEDDVFKLREALSSPAYDPEPLAKKLYDRIFRHTSAKQKTTLESDLRKLFEGGKAPTLMWSLDGVLRYVPTAALHDGEKYLVERYRHVVFNRQSLTAIGRADRKWSVLGLGVSEAKTAGGISFAALPGAEKELKDLVKAAPEEAGILSGARRINAEFTKEEAIRLWQRGQYPVVHISSHFSFNPARQEESFLLVGDGAMYFGDIKNRQGLFNSVDLLALSACDTGMTANGKESESFAYLAQSLGAKTVLASLWKVSDAGTPELMMRFYRLRSQNPQMPKGEAFRQAQLSMLTEGAGQAGGPGERRRSDELNLDGKGSSLTPYDPTGKPRYAHPFYWSAFSLIGNWK